MGSRKGCWHPLVTTAFSQMCCVCLWRRVLSPGASGFRGAESHRSFCGLENPQCKEMSRFILPVNQFSPACLLCVSHLFSDKQIIPDKMWNRKTFNKLYILSYSTQHSLKVTENIFKADFMTCVYVAPGEFLGQRKQSMGSHRVGHNWVTNTLFWQSGWFWASSV